MLNLLFLEISIVAEKVYIENCTYLTCALAHFLELYGAASVASM